MKTFIRLFAIVLIGLIVCNPVESSTTTNSLILLDQQSGIDFTDSAIELVNYYAGEVYHVFRSKALMGYVPPDKVGHLIGRAGILNIHQNQTQPDKTDPVVNSAIKAFNNLLQPAKELTKEEMEKRSLEGVKDKVRITYPTKGSKTGLSDRFTSEYMIGRVAVGIVIVEGNGDPQYDWTPQGLDSVTTQIVKGLDWLANRASESNCNVCWFYDWRYSVPVPEEPIAGPSGSRCSDMDCAISWIGYAIQALGYDPGVRNYNPALNCYFFSDGVSAVYGYVHDLRYTHETDWAFAMFVANGDTFRDGEYAWAMNWNDRHFLGQPIGRDHGGPYLAMTHDYWYFGLDDIWNVVAHETFHIFGPVDEYAGAGGACENSGSCDDEFGYLQIENRNCDYCDGSTNCVMRDMWAYYACGYTRYQAGWRDSDGDGPADPIDPNSHRFCWIGPPQVGGPVQPGDIIKTSTLQDEFVKSIAITPDNSVCSSGDYCMIMWDGTNAWGAICAPGIYLVRLNNGSAESIVLSAVDPNDHTPVFDNFQFENGILYWRLSDTWAYVRLKIYDSSDRLVLYPIKDKAYDGNTDNQTELHDLTEGAAYTSQFFGWGPAGHVSQVTEYSFVYHGPAVLSPNGGEVWEAMSTHDITWDFPGVSGNVKIRYSTDGGESWGTVVDVTPNDGVYSWTLLCSTDTLSACRIKISDGYDGVWDMSDDDFSITPSHIIAPSSLAGYQSGMNEVTLNWTYIPSPNWFGIYCDGCLCGAAEPMADTYTDGMLISDRSYIYWAKAHKHCCESDPSNADTVFVGPKLLFPVARDILPKEESFVEPLPSPKQVDSADIAINYRIVYPGHFAEIEVQLKNPMPVCGFDFVIKLAHGDLIDFHTEAISMDSILIGSVWLEYPVRECWIDTSGTLTSRFNSINSRGQVGDTSSSDCKYLWVKGWAPPGECILPYPLYQMLFKFGIDAHCISDTSTHRAESFYLTVGRLYGSEYQEVPLRYHPGDVILWWSVPGDADNDSLVSVGDIVFLVSFLYGAGPAPCIPEGGDANGDCMVNVGDVTYLVTYLYRGGPAPLPGCWHGKRD